MWGFKKWLFRYVELLYVELKMVTCPETATGKSQKSLWVAHTSVTYCVECFYGSAISTLWELFQKKSAAAIHLDTSTLLRLQPALIPSLLFDEDLSSKWSPLVCSLKLACYMKLYQCSKFGKKVTCQIIQRNTHFSTLLGPFAFCDRTRCKLGPVASSMFTTNF